MPQLPDYIKKAALDKNINPIMEYLDSAHNFDSIIALKEHKILYKFDNACDEYCVLETKYLEKVQVISPFLYQEELNYLKLVKISSLLKKMIDDQLILFSKDIIKFDDYSILSSFAIYFNKFIKKKFNFIWEKLFDQNLYNSLDSNNKAIYISSFYNFVNGQFIDDSMIEAKCINHILNIARKTNFRNRKGNIKEKLIAKYSNLMYKNYHIQYLIDMVSYGEFYVSSINDDVKFSFKDLNLEVSKRTGMRSKITNYQLINNKRPGYLYSILENVSFDFAQELRGLFEESGVGKINEKLQLDGIHRDLLSFDYEDELLFLTDKDNYILCLYTVGIILKIIAITIDSMFTDIHRYKILKDIYELPYDLIRAYLKEMQFDTQIIDKALEYYTCEKGHFNPVNFICKPFTSINNKIFCITSLAKSNNWTLSIRRDLISGGKSSNLYGMYLENYIEFILKDYSWNVIATQKQLKYNNQTVTDVDIIAERNALILLIQAKAVTGCRTPYEYWLAKNTISKGILQARLAEEYYNNNPNELSKLCKNLNINETPLVKSIVIIPNEQFIGWNCDQVPVISLNYFLSVLGGAKNNTVTDDNKTVLQKFYLPSNARSQELFEILKNPYYRDVYTPKMKIQYNSLTIGGVKFKLPSLESKDMEIISQGFDILSSFSES